MDFVNVLRGLKKSRSEAKLGLSDRLTVGRKSSKTRIKSGGGGGTPIGDIPEDSTAPSLHSPLHSPARQPYSPPDAPLPCCPTCRLPFDTGRKRRLLDACGHERCYSCVFLQENCPICHDTTVQNSLHSPLHGSLQGSMHGSLQALPRPASAIDPSCQYGAHVSSTPTPVIRRPRPAPSPMPGRPGSWVQRYNRRPVTVSIDDTLSDDASSTSSNPASQCSKTREKSAGQESGFQSSASLASHSPPGLRPLDHVVPAAPESLASGVSSLHLPSLGPRRSSIGHLRPSSAASSRTAAARRSARLANNRDAKSLTGSQPLLASQYRPVQWFLKPLFFEVPQREKEPVLVVRQWLYQDMVAHLASDLSTNRGIVLTGAPGCGKTTLILQLVENSCFGRGQGMGEQAKGKGKQALEATKELRKLASEVVSFHFCQIDNSVTCMVGEWVHSLSAQLAQAPALAAYHQLLSTDHSLRSRLSLSQCNSDPHAALLQGILQPLTILKQGGKITEDRCVILIDALCEANFHRPDYGNTLASFLTRHLEAFPSWLKVVVTVRSDKMTSVQPLPFLAIRMDSDTDERPGLDISEFVFKRISRSEVLLANITPPSGRPVGEGPQARLKSFQKYLADTAKGCFLFVKLTLDLIERGHLVLKSSSFNVLPQSLSEVFLLEFNLKFPSLQSFRKVSDILSVVLAALQPLTMPEIHQTVSALSVGPAPSWTQFLENFRCLEDYLVTRRDDSVMFFHPLFREWLIRRGETEPDKFVCDPRTGHAAAALKISRQVAPVDSEKTLELAHHLLKAHIYRNSSNAVPSRDLQSQWIGFVSEDVSEALGHPSNLASPNLKVSRLLLLSGASPDFITPSLGKAPMLCVAAHQGHQEMVSLLLEFGASISATNQRGVPALSFATAAGQLDTVRLLVESGANVGQRDASGASALVLAARAGHLACLEHLVSCDWQVDGEELSLGEAAQQSAVAAAASGHVVLLEFLLDMAEVLVDKVDTLMGETALCAAAAAGRLECCEALLRRGASLGSRNIKEMTPLHLGAREGHWPIVELLLKSGAEVGQTDAQGRTALMVAAMAGHQGVVELLLAREAVLEQKDGAGLTALMWASAKGQQPVVELLLGKGAVVGVKDNQGRTSLDFAAEQGEPSLVQVLLDRGADMEQMDTSGLRPLDRAIAARNPDAVATFLRRGAKLGPSTWAAAKDKPEILLILLNKLLEDGNTLFKKQKVTEAAQRYSYASKRLPTENQGPHNAVFHQLRVHLLLNLSRCKRKQLDFTEAAKLATEALSLAPSCPEAFHARAKANHEAGKLDAAMRDLTEAVKVAPQNRELHRILLGLKLEVKAKEGSPVPETCEARLSVESSSGVCSETSEASGEVDVRRATLL